MRQAFLLLALAMLAGCAQAAPPAQVAGLNGQGYSTTDCQALAEAQADQPPYQWAYVARYHQIYGTCRAQGGM